MHEKKAKKTLRKYFYVKILQNDLNFDQLRNAERQLISYERLLHCSCSIVAVSAFVLLWA